MASLRQSWNSFFQYLLIVISLFFQMIDWLNDIMITNPVHYKRWFYSGDNNWSLIILLSPTLTNTKCSFIAASTDRYKGIPSDQFWFVHQRQLYIFFHKPMKPMLPRDTRITSKLIVQRNRRGAIAQSVERTTPGEEVMGSIAAVAARSLLVGSVSV